MKQAPLAAVSSQGTVKLFLAGDVMTGRGIDQILPHAVDPELHESYVRDARDYVALAERQNGPIPDEADYRYVWGDALAELERQAPDARIINLETAVSDAPDWWRAKAIHYRMHPENVRLLLEAGIDVCILGNNHVLDWGLAGLRETVEVLAGQGIRVVGAGLDAAAAAEPAVVPAEGGRLLVHAWGTPGAGVPAEWAAGPDRPGVNVLTLGPGAADRVAEHVLRDRRDGDRIVVSVHWGPNWGYEVPDEQRRFAHRVIDAGAADLVFGHSSHHPKGMEVYRNRLILYGAGDFLNDYEGIGGRSEYRGELTLMYFPELAPSGRLIALVMTPMRIRRFRLERAARDEAGWLAERLDSASGAWGAGVRIRDDGRLVLAADGG